ncbi:PLP-dependent aminotransferase family protein [Ktedonosporobacter rubrisoli]|uniref:PLP-dependent aminotransferase family protein n=1 Tax=Ktedonosporobacter rubrisoli TaxID=2509675 RepID=A0A4P6JLP6_KTERU|nr:PLP-dependent aminotransferase family protein [Ktedonosporobacter rubrisoli]QBD76003.1 PLP-dependent aminotransferase family protein [Ktedonosporobacter rubrisoli]
MPRRALPGKRPEIKLDATLPVPLYKQLYERLRTAILSGLLERGARLPSTRALASELGVARMTVALAYQQLVLEGYLESKVGQGTVVARSLPAALFSAEIDSKQEAQTDASKTIPIQVAPYLPRLKDVPWPSRGEGQTGGPFAGGEPGLELFPYKVWARLIARRARQSMHEYAHYQPPAGYFPLREAIAAHIGVTRGVRCTPEHIMITAGSQGALDLAARTLLSAGEAVWLENPGYFGARGALLAAGARLVPVPVDEQGLMVEVGRKRCPDARLAFTTPSHQFPTGVTMSLARRMLLLDWARNTGAWILEDDYDSEFRFSGRPLEALQGLDNEGRVLYIGTFSKVLFPALRLGYLVAPAELIEPLLLLRRSLDMHLPMLEQMALFDFLHEGHYARHLRRMRHHYQELRDLLQRELQAQLGDLLEVRAPDAGMHLVGWLPLGKDDRRASQLAARAHIQVLPISTYSLEPLARGGLVFGYAGTSQETLPREVKRLRAALALL